MRGFRVSRPAQRDLARILAYSRKRFGLQIADAYETLLIKAFAMIRAEPFPKSVRRVEGSPSLLRVHLRSVPQASPKLINRPRHVVVFQQDEACLTIVRILHEKMDEGRQLR